ncbi:hypothetical protein [Pseudoalteromonas piscicida]
MFLKVLKATALIALEVMIDDDKKSDRDKLIDDVKYAAPQGIKG